MIINEKREGTLITCLISIDWVGKNNKMTKQNRTKKNINNNENENNK
jgi:hypothetical protein